MSRVIPPYEEGQTAVHPYSCGCEAIREDRDGGMKTGVKTCPKHQGDIQWYARLMVQLLPPLDPVQASKLAVLLRGADTNVQTQR